MKALTVLKALELGMEVQIDGTTYGMSEEFDLITKMTVNNGSEPTVRWLTCNLPLNTFILMCERKISDDEHFLLSSTIALNKMGG